MRIVESKKKRLQNKNAKNLSMFRKLVTGMEKSIKEIEAEEVKEQEKIAKAKANLSDYKTLKEESLNVISGISALLSGKLNLPTKEVTSIKDAPEQKSN